MTQKATVIHDTIPKIVEVVKIKVDTIHVLNNPDRDWANISLTLLGILVTPLVAWLTVYLTKEQSKKQLVEEMKLNRESERIRKAVGAFRGIRNGMARAVATKDTFKRAKELNKLLDAILHSMDINMLDFDRMDELIALVEKIASEDPVDIETKGSMLNVWEKSMMEQLNITKEDLKAY